MKLRRLLILNLLLILMLTPVCFSSFDNLSSYGTDVVTCGSWGYFYDNIPVTSVDIIKYIDLQYPDTLVNQFLKDSFFHTISGESVLFNLYDNYTMKDMKDAVGLAGSFQSSFISLSAESQVLTTADTPVTLDASLVGSLLPGDFRQIKQVIHSADVAPGGTFEIYLSLMSPTQNMFDFTVEIFFDSRVFASQNLFSYSADIASLYLSNPQTYTQATPSPVANTNYQTRYKDNKTNATYNYSMNIPSYPGNWSRFFLGPNYYASGTKNFKNYLLETSPVDRTGMILLGRNSGGISEMRLRITSRVMNPIEVSSVIPIIICIGRGIPTNGTPSTVAVAPTVSFGVKKIA